MRTSSPYGHTPVSKIAQPCMLSAMSQLVNLRSCMPAGVVYQNQQACRLSKAKTDSTNWPTVRLQACVYQPVACASTVLATQKPGTTRSSNTCMIHSSISKQNIETIHGGLDLTKRTSGGPCQHAGQGRSPQCPSRCRRLPLTARWQPQVTSRTCCNLHPCCYPNSRSR